MAFNYNLDIFVPADKCGTNNEIYPVFMFKTSDMAEEDSPIMFTFYKTILNNGGESSLYKVTDKSHRFFQLDEYYAVMVRWSLENYRVFRIFPFFDLSELAELLESYAKEVNYKRVPVLVLNYGAGPDDMYDRIEFKDTFSSSLNGTHAYDIYSCFNTTDYNTNLSGMPNTYHFDIVWVNDLGSTIV